MFPLVTLNPPWKYFITIATIEDMSGDKLAGFGVFKS
jgi:hypothetical protein